MNRRGREERFRSEVQRAREARVWCHGARVGAIRSIRMDDAS
jgi:hypothetical protein